MSSGNRTDGVIIFAIPATVAASQLTGYSQRLFMAESVTQRVLARLREEMRTKKISQTDLETFSGLSQSSLSKLFHGKREMGLEDAAALAQGVGLAVTELVRDHGLEFCAEMTPTELRLLERLRQLDQPTRDAVLQLLDVKTNTRPQPRRALPAKTGRKRMSST